MVTAVVLANCSEDSDLAHLNIRRWQVDRSMRSRAVVLCLHGIESHGGWFETFATDLVAAGVDCLTYDRLGNGLNLTSSVSTLNQMMSDLKQLMSILQNQYEQVVVFGMSWGGLFAAHAVAQGVIEPRYSILMVPGIYSHRNLSFTQLLKVLKCMVFGSDTEIPIPIDIEDFSKQDAVRTIIKNDPMRRSRVPASLLLATQKMRIKVRGAKLPSDRTEVWLAEFDEIIDNASLLRFSEALGLTVRVFKEHGHALIFECPEKLSKMLVERMRSLGLL